MSARLTLRVQALMAVSLGLAFAGSGSGAWAAGIVDGARKGDLDTVSRLIAAGEDVNLPASDGSTALLWATYHSYPEMAQSLIAAGADVDAGNRYGVTPLLQASRIGDTTVMQVLLAAGADPELAHPDGETPLMAAALSGSVDAVSMLLEHGADPNVADSFQEQTALMRAAAEGHADVVAALLRAGAEPDARARVSELTERSINTDYPSGGFNALMWAARNGYVDIVEQLAAAGADLDLRNGDGATAAMIAIVNDRFDLAARLVELGANPDDGSLYHAVEMRDATTDWYARDGSRLRANHPNDMTALDLIAMLLDAGADPNKAFVGQMHSSTMCCDSYANATPVYRAAVAADVEALKLLLEHGGDAAWTPSEVEGAGRANGNVGKPALIAAINGGKGVPLSAGPGYSREGPPPFREPSNREPADAVQLLLEAGANPDAAMPEDASFALHEAVKTRNLDTIRALVDAGARLGVKNKDGLTPLHVAEALPTKKSDNVFAPGAANLDGASPDEIAGLLRAAMQAASVPIEPAPVKEDAQEGAI